MTEISIDNINININININTKLLRVLLKHIMDLLLKLNVGMFFIFIVCLQWRC